MLYGVETSPSSTPGAEIFPAGASLKANPAVTRKASARFAAGAVMIDGPVIPYVTSAVHFNGSAYLTRGAAITGWGTPSKFTFAIWTKISAASDGIFSDANEFTQGTTSGGGFDYLNVNVHFTTYFDSVPNATITSAGWQGIFCAVDLGATTAQLYRGDISVIANASVNTGTIAVGSNFWFGQDGFGTKITGDVADFRLWLGTALDLSDVTNRRLLLDAGGKPVAPSLANGVLGTPIISFIGNSTNFPINGGSGGSFSVTGSLTNASSSPTD